MKPTRRQLLAGGAAVLGTALFVPYLDGDANSTTHPSQRIEFPCIQVPISEKYSHIKTLGDLAGEERVCLMPPDREDPEDIKNFLEERERAFIKTRSGFQTRGNSPNEELRYLEFKAQYGAEDKTQIMGVADLRGIDGLSEAYNNGAPLSHLVRYTAATGDFPMHILLTETAANYASGKERENMLFKQNLIQTFSPKIPVTVVPNNSEAAKLIRNEPCRTGIHEFFPREKPSQRYKFTPPAFSATE